MWNINPSSNAGEDFWGQLIALWPFASGSNYSMDRWVSLTEAITRTGLQKSWINHTHIYRHVFPVLDCLESSLPLSTEEQNIDIAATHIPYIILNKHRHIWVFVVPCQIYKDNKYAFILSRLAKSLLLSHRHKHFGSKIFCIKFWTLTHFYFYIGMNL